MDIYRDPLTAADVDMLNAMLGAACRAADPDLDSQIEAVHTVFLLVEQL